MLENNEIKTVRGNIAGMPVTYETGRLAKQAGGAVLATMGGTVVLAAVTVSNSAKEGLDFFPLTVDYFEKMYAAGKIPGGFYKREGRPSEREILRSRLIDRSIRPLFPSTSVGKYRSSSMCCPLMERILLTYWPSTRYQRRRLSAMLHSLRQSPQ